MIKLDFFSPSDSFKFSIVSVLFEANLKYFSTEIALKVENPGAICQYGLFLFLADVRRLPPGEKLRSHCVWHSSILSSNVFCYPIQSTFLIGGPGKPNWDPKGCR